MSEIALAIVMFLTGFALGGLWQMRQTDDALKLVRETLDLYDNLAAAVRDMRTNCREFHMELAGGNDDE